MKSVAAMLAPYILARESWVPRARTAVPLATLRQDQTDQVPVIAGGASCGIQIGWAHQGQA